jgi:hypothetical protein
MNTAPLVTCVCPTFNRPPASQWLVEEAVQSFLGQDYPHRELVIINDCPGQVLQLDYPRVAVINVGRRFRTLGEKLNAAIGLGQGALIAPWDDDDISLPWRLSRSIENLGQADYYNPSRYWFIDHAGLHGDHAMGLAHGCSIFTRRAFDLVGGYPHNSGRQDLELDQRLRADPRVAVASPPELGRPDWYYVYRWGVSPVHLSGRMPHEPWYDEIGRRPVTAGVFDLRPHWRDDYVSCVRQATAEYAGPAAARAATITEEG